MCYNSLRGLVDLVNLQVELSSLPELTELRKTQVKTQLALERATETITSKLVESMTGPDATKNADIKSAADLVSLAESMKIDTADAKTKLANLINNQLESILKKYS
jgi:hypothetical protein